MSYCWWQWWYDFIDLKNRIEKLPWVNNDKLDKLYSDIEMTVCHPHDDRFTQWWWIIDYIRANYIFCIDLLGLLHWTSSMARFWLFLIVFTGLNLFWFKYFNFK